MSDLRDQIRRYHEKMHADHLGFTVDTLPVELMQFRRNLHDEEVEEVSEAWDYYETAMLDNRDTELAHLLHELADVVIVAFGTADYLGINFDDVLNAVMRANMRKIPPKVPGGKATKPEGWQPCDPVIVEMIKASRRAADPFAPAPVRTPRSAPARARYAGEYGPAFSANFEGICPECDDEIETGDSIRMGEDGAVHTECADAPDIGPRLGDGIPS